MSHIRRLVMANNGKNILYNTLDCFKVQNNKSKKYLIHRILQKSWIFKGLLMQMLQRLANS